MNAFLVYVLDRRVQDGGRDCSLLRGLVFDSGQFAELLQGPAFPRGFVVGRRDGYILTAQTLAELFYL